MCVLKQSEKLELVRVTLVWLVRVTHLHHPVANRTRGGGPLGLGTALGSFFPLVEPLKGMK